MSSSHTDKTRPCSVVFFNEQKDYLNLRFACRPLDLDFKPKSRLFKAYLGMKKEEVLEILKDLQKRERAQEN